MDIVKLVSVLPSAIRGVADPKHLYPHDLFGSLCTKTEEAVLTRFLQFDKLDEHACSQLCLEEQINPEVIKSEILKLDPDVTTRLTKECASVGFGVDDGLLFITYIARVKDRIEQAKNAALALDASDIVRTRLAKQGALGLKSSPLRTNRILSPQPSPLRSIQKYGGKIEITQEKISDLAIASLRLSLFESILSNLCPLYIKQCPNWIPKSNLEQAIATAKTIITRLSKEKCEQMITEAISCTLPYNCNLKMLNPDEKSGAYWTLLPIVPAESYATLISIYPKCALSREQGDLIIATISNALYAQFCDLVESSLPNDIDTD